MKTIGVIGGGSHQIRRIFAGGITTIAGTTGTAGFSGDGGSPLAGDLNFPFGLAIDSAGGLYIADFGNNRIRAIRYSLAALE